LVAVLAPAVPFRLLLGTAVASVITLGHARRLVRWELIRLVAVGVAAAVGAWIGLVQATALVSMMTILSLTQVHRQAARLGGEAPPRRELVAAFVACVVVLGLTIIAATALN
jgi:hypothetical protein